jgi:transcriptional regulator of arginine metabolism
VILAAGYGKADLHTYTLSLYIYASAAATARPRFCFVRKKDMKFQRHNAIRELVAHVLVANQDELRRKLRRRGFEVTQATLSRDIHELRLTKGPGGYSLPNGNGNGNGAGTHAADDGPPSVAEMMESFGLEVRHAMNQVVLRTTMGGAQPLAAALDREGWNDVLGTIAGDDTVLVICPDLKRAHDTETRLRKMLES